MTKSKILKSILKNYKFYKQLDKLGQLIYLTSNENSWKNSDGKNNMYYYLIRANGLYGVYSKNLEWSNRKDVKKPTEISFYELPNDIQNMFLTVYHGDEVYSLN